MQHTLIPYKDRQRLHREYIMRVVAVFVFSLAVAMAIGVVSLFPAFISSISYDNAVGNAISVGNKNRADTGLEKAVLELTASNKLLTSMGGSSAGARYSDIVRALTQVRGSAVITSFAMNQVDQKTVSVTIKGTVPTRADLLAFRGRLEALMPGNKIDIPIDQLAKNANLSFSLKFNRQIP